jgi:hypothetical protein
MGAGAHRRKPSNIASQSSDGLGVAMGDFPHAPSQAQTIPCRWANEVAAALEPTPILVKMLVR